jgi:TRAP-type mannitol/chloroaromatic compound transport system substrate-binding protein
MHPRVLLRRRLLLAATGVAAMAGLTATQPRPALSQNQYRWRMMSRWQPNFPDRFAAAQRLANRIASLSEDRLRIEVLPADEELPEPATLTAVRDGTVEMCYGLSYDWRSLSPACDFFFVAPFGFTQTEMNVWLSDFGGQDLWDEAYAPLGVKPFPAGSLGAQAFGWSREEIETLSDLKGLRFRTTGLGVDVLSKLGVEAIALKPDAILPAMEAGQLDAFELVGPLVDLEFGLYRAAPYYYFPSYNQPSGTIELSVNRSRYEALPSDLQQVIAIATEAENERGWAEANAGNARALSALQTEHGVQVRQLPAEILVALGNASGEVISEIRVAGDEIVRRTIDSFRSTRKTLMDWSNTSERSFLNARTLPFNY